VNGQISPSIDLKLVDVQLGSGEGFTAADVPHPRGEIWVRSKDAHMTKAYWKRPLASAEVWTDGWYRTGDVGLLERVPGREDPLLHVVDRVKNLTEMYVGGESVWAPLAELEETVYASCSAVHRVFLVADRNQPYPVAVVVPHR
jgi:long-subunit acyl-CoA synthetase (AMP-forming)